MKLKLIFSPFGLTVPRWKINRISRCFFFVYATTLVQVRGVALCSGTNIHRTRYYTRACFDHFYVYVIA